MAAWPKLAEVRTRLRLQPDSTEDAVIASALAAAIDYGIRITGNQWPVTETALVPDACHEAAILDAAHLYRRRDSLDGTIAWGDQGAIRVGSKLDPDAARLYSLYQVPVFG